MAFTRRKLMSTSLAFTLSVAMAGTAFAQDKIKLRLSAVASDTDARAVAMTEVFGPKVADFADFEPHWNGTLFEQGTELEAIATGDLEMSITSAQELSNFIPEFSIFTAGYVMRDADHQVAVFNAPVMDQFKEKAEEVLGVKLLNVMYLGRRQVNLRQPKSELEIKIPADLAGVNLRMPGSDAWQFLGSALGANPVPMAFTEVYAGLSAGSVDGQDNPLPTTVDMKFYEVTKQVALTSHLVDLNYLAISNELWNSLTEEQQAQMEKAAWDAADAERASQLAQEEELVTFLEEQGLDVYTPDVDAFREHVLAQYADSDFSKDWPEGALEAISGL